MRSCGACEAECHVGAISQGADHYEIEKMHVLTVALVQHNAQQEQSLLNNK